MRRKIKASAGSQKLLLIFAAVLVALVIYGIHSCQCSRDTDKPVLEFVNTNASQAYVAGLRENLLHEVVTEKKSADDEIIVPPNYGTENGVEWFGPGLGSRIGLELQYFFIRVPSNQSSWSPPHVAISGPSGTQLDKEELMSKEVSHTTYCYIYKATSSGRYSVSFEVGPTKVASKAFYQRPNTCHCAQPFEVFERRYGCRAKWKQVAEGMYRRWDTGSVSKQLMRETQERVTQSRAKWGARYVILNNRLFKGTSQDYVGSAHHEDILMRILNEVRLPDTDVIFSTSDYPQTQYWEPHPVLGWCTGDMFGDIAWPYFWRTMDALDGLYVRLAHGGPPWADRVPRVYFRGSQTLQVNADKLTAPYVPRIKAAMLGKARPDVFDIRLKSFSGTQALHLQPDAYDVVKARTLPFEQDAMERMRDFKYLLALDGKTGVTRVAGCLHAGGVLVKQASVFHEFFYALLKPYQHFVPVRPDLTDLVAAAEWLRTNDREAEEMARAGQRLATSFLRAEDHMCYMAYVLRESSRILAYTPTTSQGMSQVRASHAASDPSCSCPS